MLRAPEIWFPNLNIILYHVSRVAFTVFGVPIYWYGVCIVIGVALALLLGLREAKRTGQNPDNYMDFLIIALICAIIGARLYYVAFTWDYYKDHLAQIVDIRQGGLAVYGGTIAAFLAAVVYTKRKKLNLGLFADTAAPSIAIGQAIGRWGNFFNREAFGGFTQNLFAMRIPVQDASGANADVLAHTVAASGATYIQVHPTFLYESAWDLLVFLALFLIRPKKAFHGQIIILYAMFYAVGRFFIEGLRTDQLQLFGVAVSQVVSAALVVIGLVAMIVLLNRKKKGLISLGIAPASVPAEGEAAQTEEAAEQETEESEETVPVSEPESPEEEPEPCGESEDEPHA